MKPSVIESKLVDWFFDSLAPNGPSIYLEGAPGRGKTSVMMTVPAKLDAAMPGKRHGIVVLNGATVSLTTMTGYLWPVEKGGEAFSRFTKPDWWTNTQDAEGNHARLPLEAFDGGIIFVDEQDKMGADEKKILGEAKLSKRLASHDLPEGWVVWGAGNRAKDRSGSTKNFDHVINRERIIEWTDDIESLTNWMTQHGCLAETILFAEENPNIVFPDEVPKEQGPFCTPRSLVEGVDAMLRRRMERYKLDKIPLDPATVEEIRGSIGAGAAEQYVVKVRLGQELPRYEEILENPMGVKIPTKPDAQMLAAFKYADRVTVEEAAPIITYIARLPKEFAPIFARRSCLREPGLIRTKAFLDWCKANATLVSVLTKAA